MSRAFMPFYFGDYLRDTGHLTTEQHGAYFLLLGHCWEHEGVIPLNNNERAAIAKLTAKRWHAIKAPIERFFNPDGTQKRVSKELAKADVVSVRRKIAGARGGFHSAIARAKQNPSKPPAKGKQMTKQMPSKSEANDPAKPEQNSSNRIHNHNHIKNLTSSEYEAARATPEEMPTDQQDNTAGSLATALRGGALTRPPDAEPAATPAKPPSELTRAELEATFERRRASDAAAAAARARRVWGRSQPPPPAASNAVEKQEGTTDVER
jgi:uncharacterized protein YdaU (DUF1376 family)